MNWNLADLANQLRDHKRENNAWRLGVKKPAIDSFWRAINDLQLAGKKEISPVELDGLVLNANESQATPQSKQRRLPAPSTLAITGPTGISISKCLELVDDVQTAGRESAASVAPEICGAVRGELHRLQAEGAGAIALEQFNTIFRRAAAFVERSKKLVGERRLLAFRIELIENIKANRFDLIEKMRAKVA